MPSNFGLPGYISEGDAKFPWYNDNEEATSLGSVGSRGNAKEARNVAGGDEGEGVRDAMGALDDSVEGSDPPVV